MIASRVIDELKEQLSAAYGDRLHAVVLFGSEARGNAGPDSDIDVLAVLDKLTEDFGDELERGLTAVARYSARYVVRAWRHERVHPQSMGEGEAFACCR